MKNSAARERPSGKRGVTQEAVSHGRAAGLVDVARLAGVSASTVSGVFRDTTGKYPVLPATREKVMAAARQLGYRPNSLARAMRRQRYQQIGFLVQQPDRSFNVLPESLAGVFDATAAADHHLVMIGLHPEFCHENHAMPHSIEEECVDGMVIDATLCLTAAMTTALHGSRFPIVEINGTGASNCVTVDDEALGLDATDFLLGKGCCRPAFFSFRRARAMLHPSFDIRRSAYFRRLAAAGLRAREICVDFTESWHETTRALFEAPDRPDGVFCYQDLDAIQLQRVLLGMGIKLPDDMPIIGVNGAMAAMLAPAPLATMQIPWYELGSSAARMVLELADNPSKSQVPARQFKAQLVEVFHSDHCML